MHSAVPDWVTVDFAASNGTPSGRRCCRGVAHPIGQARFAWPAGVQVLKSLVPLLVL